MKVHDGWACRHWMNLWTPGRPCDESRFYCLIAVCLWIRPQNDGGQSCVPPLCGMWSLRWSQWAGSQGRPGTWSPVWRWDRGKDTPPCTYRKKSNVQVSRLTVCGWSHDWETVRYCMYITFSSVWRKLFNAPGLFFWALPFSLRDTLNLFFHDREFASNWMKCERNKYLITWLIPSFFFKDIICYSALSMFWSF